MIHKCIICCTYWCQRCYRNEILSVWQELFLWKPNVKSEELDSNLDGMNVSEDRAGLYSYIQSITLIKITSQPSSLGMRIKVNVLNRKIKHLNCTDMSMHRTLYTSISKDVPAVMPGIWAFKKCLPSRLSLNAQIELIQVKAKT